MAKPNKEFFKRRYDNNITAIRQLKLDRGCTDCGYNAHHAGLQFDHIKPRKRGTVASQMGKSLKIIMEEIDLCEVVCSTCHSIRSFNRAQEFWELRRKI